MPSFSGRIKVSLLGAVALWIFARSVFAMSGGALPAAHPAPGLDPAASVASVYRN